MHETVLTLSKEDEEDPNDSTGMDLSSEREK